MPRPLRCLPGRRDKRVEVAGEGVAVIGAVVVDTEVDGGVVEEEEEVGTKMDMEGREGDTITNDVIL